ncbi:MAG: efflux RND transporter periplasmic adaptor subunit [Patescibacteria group bacterium]|nr:efflux RND transporter periplasmic adaptor subunit [Patescibacteria group bacterium]
MLDLRNKGLGRNKVIIVFTILAILTIIFYQRLVVQENGDQDIDSSDVRQVATMSVRNLSLNKDPLPLLGKVQSQSSANIYSQISGEVIGVYKKLGDTVWSNQIIGELDNWTQKSAVTQAEASVEVAQAGLDKIKKGGRDEQTSILKTTLDNVQNTLTETKISVVNTLNDSFAKADDSIRNKMDAMFRDARGDDPQVIFPVVDSQLEIDLEWRRLLLEEMLEEWSDTLTTFDVEDDLIGELDKRKSNINSIRVFLDKLALAVNILTPTSNLSETTITTWKTNISTTRTVINTSATALSTAKNSLNGAYSNFEIAELNYEQAQTGGRSEDVISAEAQLKQAEAGLQSAYANLEKTIIRASISGTINILNLEKGDFVSAFTPVVSIANNKSLEVVTYITEEDRDDVEVGSKVLVGSKWQGEVKNIAPAIDNKTKKIKVEVTLKDSDMVLTNGQSVSLLVERIFQEVEEELTELSVPISALKIGSADTTVFTVGEGNKLISHPVILGPILGEKIIIKEGVTADMEIVIDARGLKEGQIVESL